MSSAVAATLPSAAPAPARDPCSGATHREAYGTPLPAAAPTTFSMVAGPAVSGTAVAATATAMRFLLLGGLCSLVFATSVLAGPRPCGDEVSGRAVPCSCGDVLVSSRTLGPDDPVTREPCAGSGLMVDVPSDAPAATLNLGGQAITGSGRGVGIQVLRGGSAGLRVVGPGSIRGFAVGLLASGALSYAGNVTAEGNGRDGISIAGEDYEVSSCEASHNGRDGFALRGRRYRVHGNRALDN